MGIIGKDITRAIELLNNKELVAIPTETVYGLAANGLDADAVLKIYEAKNRPSFNPLILHVADMQHAQKLVADFPERARLLAEKFWPGPLTIVLKKRDIIPDLVTAGLDAVGVRVPAHSLTLKLLKYLNFPLAAPSANPSGYVSPTTPQHVEQQLGDKVAYILDGGKCSVGIESTIVKVINDELIVLRLGGIEMERIEAAIGTKRLPQQNEESLKVESPGMMASHYAPRKKFVLGNIDDNLIKYSTEKIGILFFQKTRHERPDVPGVKPVKEAVLSPEGDLHEAARNLFSYLRELDESDSDVILAEPVPDEGLGRAINDRLRRAAAGFS